MLDDIRRLVADDTVATIEELTRLRNVRYHHAPVSLYGGMTDLPLIVERPEPRHWFADDGSLTEGRLWAEHDLLMRGETDKMSRELRENLFGDDVWRTLEYSTRVFLASAEATFRARRHDPAYDFAPARRGIHQGDRDGDQCTHLSAAAQVVFERQSTGTLPARQ